MSTGASTEVPSELSHQAADTGTSSGENGLVGREPTRDESNSENLATNESESRPEPGLLHKSDSSSNQNRNSDRKILLEHEQAVQKLSELQMGMIGGEKAGMSLYHVVVCLWLHVKLYSRCVCSKNCNQILST